MASRNVSGEARIPKGSGEHSGEWTKGSMSASGKTMHASAKKRAADAAKAAEAALHKKLSEKAKKGHKPVDKKKALVAFEGEQLIIYKKLGLEMTPQAFAVDGFFGSGKGSVGIEVKSLIDTGLEKVNMKQSSIGRKLKWWGNQRGTKKLPVSGVDLHGLHTVAVDFRHGRPPTIYHRQGVGAYMLSTMTKVKSTAHLKKLLGMK